MELLHSLFDTVDFMPRWNFAHWTDLHGWIHIVSNWATWGACTTILEEEFRIMKRHAIIGAETLNAAIANYPEVQFLKIARDIALSHHERSDGTGYPFGLVCEQIPLCGRIVALADVYDALRSKRVYKSAFTHETTRNMSLVESGKHFDTAVVDAFYAIEDTFRELNQNHIDEAESAKHELAML